VDPGGQDADPARMLIKHVNVIHQHPGHTSILDSLILTKTRFTS